MVVLKGKIAAGENAAHKHLPKQLPVFVRQYGELCGAYAGTINVEVESSFDCLTIDFKSDPFEVAPGEWHRFEFVRVWFEFPLGVKKKAWIYQPYGHHFRQGKDKYLEILVSEELEGVSGGKDCQIHVLNDHFGSESTSIHYVNRFDRSGA